MGTAGGLTVSWDKSVRLKVLYQDDNQINCEIWNEKTKSVWILTCMYGSPYKDHRKEKSWDVVNHMGNSMNTPWLVLGDLNVILQITMIL